MSRKYDDKFKINIVGKVLDGQSVKSVLQEMGVNEGLIHTVVGKSLSAKRHSKFEAIKRKSGLKETDSRT